MLRTINDAYLDLRIHLKEAGVAGYQLEARELVQLAAGLSREEFALKKSQYIFERVEERLAELVELRLSGMPIQYIVGEWEFYSLTFELSRDTLIPRIDSEALAACGIAHLDGRDKGRLLDLCCGSGCIGIAVLKNCDSGITGVFCDISEGALRMTRKNLIRHQLTARALTVRADVREPHQEASGKYNLILCNPPYITTREMEELSVEVKNEPWDALHGGGDGLDFYRAIAKNYKTALTRGGLLMLEVGAGQSREVGAILTREGYSDIRYVRDGESVERVVTGKA